MSTLTIKVSIARRPVSNKARAIRILAGYGDRITTNNAAFYAELGFAQFDEVALTAVIKRAVADTKASHYEVKINGEVNKILAA